MKPWLAAGDADFAAELVPRERRRDGCGSGVKEREAAVADLDDK